MVTNASLSASSRKAGRSHYYYLSGLLVLCSIVFATVPSGFQYDLTADSDTLLEGNWLTRVQWAPIYLLALYLAWRHRSVCISFLRQINPFLIALILLMSISAIWSPLPEVTLRRGLPFVFVLMLGLGVHLSGWYPHRLIHLLYISFGGLLIASIIAAVAFPSFGIHTVGEFVGLWRGIAGDKNQMAKLAGICTLFGMHGYLTSKNRKFWHGTFFCLAFLGLVMSGGKASLMAALVSMFLMFTLLRQPLTNRYWLPVTIVCSFLLIAIPLHFYIIAYGVPTYTDIVGPLFELLGKEPSLTGRDDIWVWVLPIVKQHWLLGYGYGAFWVGDFGLSGEIAQHLDYYPWQSHNGYLEITNELGVIGLALLIGFIVYHIRQLFRARHVDHAAFAFYLPLLALVLITSLSESVLFNGLSIYTWALLLSSVAVSRILWTADASANSIAKSREPTGPGWPGSRAPSKGVDYSSRSEII